MPSAKSVVIIGGGAAGLMAAYELSKHKIYVTVLEAKQRTGGRIHTLINNGFSQPIEAGAEFIHGNLPVTLQLLDEARIQYHAVNDTMYRLEKGEFKKENHFAQHWNLLMRQMATLQEDMPLAVFLDKFFGDDKYADFRISIENFAGGFDLADVNTASTKALYREWSKEMETQYRIDGGYKKLIDYLETACKKKGCVFSFSCCAKKINWNEEQAGILTMCSRIYKADKVIIAVPISVLQAETNSEDYLEFSPAIPKHIQAAKNIGFGAVIKIILEFNINFWNEKKKDAGFIFTETEVPTWWTQLPVENNIITGWLGGKRATVLKNETDEVILEKALQSLSTAFYISVEEVHKNLMAFKIANWCKEPDISGGYSFNTIESIEAKHILRQHVENVIFFTGEALYEGVPGGTVEAALSSGKKTAEAVLKSLEE